MSSVDRFWMPTASCLFGSLWGRYCVLTEVEQHFEARRLDDDQDAV